MEIANIDLMRGDRIDVCFANELDMCRFNNFMKAAEKAFDALDAEPVGVFTARQVQEFIASRHDGEHSKATGRAWITEFGKYLAKMQAEKAA